MRAEPRCGQNQTHSEQCNPVVAGRQLHHCQAVIRLRPIKDAYRATAGGKGMYCIADIIYSACSAHRDPGLTPAELEAAAASSEWVACKLIVCEREVQCMQCCPLWVCMQFCPLSKIAWNSRSVKECVQFFPLWKTTWNSPSVKECVQFFPLSKTTWDSPSVKECGQFFPLALSESVCLILSLWEWM